MSRADQDEFPGDTPMVRIGHMAERTVAFTGLAMKVSKYTESPIETMLAVAILCQWPDVRFVTHDAEPCHGWSLIPQYQWEKYRVDLALRKPDGRLIFIECDGKDFHSSPDQIERDAARERMMIDAGFIVVRFTGAEINHSPAACADTLRRFRRWGT
jgi:hypothetical protein